MHPLRRPRFRSADSRAEPRHRPSHFGNTCDEVRRKGPRGVEKPPQSTANSRGMSTRAQIESPPAGLPELASGPQVPGRPHANRLGVETPSGPAAQSRGLPHRLASIRDALGEVTVQRGPAFMDAFLFLLAICAIILPTTAGYALATAAAQSIVGLPFAVLMFLSPFGLMALLPLRLLQLTLDGLFGIRLRLGLLAPLALVSLAMFLFLGPLRIQSAPAPAEVLVSVDDILMRDRS